MKRILWTAGILIAVVMNGAWGQDAAPAPELVYCDSGSGSLWDQLEFNGYANAGYFGNTDGQDYNGNVNTNSESGGALNGIYLAVGKSAENGGCGFNWGFQADFMFGQDSRFMRVGGIWNFPGMDGGWDEDLYTGHNGRGDETYGFAAPQAYMDLAVNNWVFRGGHFYTPMGYEGARADSRFFYSRGLSFDSNPVTHTGAMGYFKGFQNLEIGAGWVKGCDWGFNDDQGGSLFIFTTKYHFNPCTSIKYSALAGDWVDYTVSYGNESFREHLYGQMHSIVFEYQPTCQWVFATTLDYKEVTSGYSEQDSICLGQHAYYTINLCWSLGMRAEWLEKDSDEWREEYVSLTFGANWMPWANQNFRVRPEVRYDKCNRNVYDGENKDDQVCLGLDVMYAF